MFVRVFSSCRHDQAIGRCVGVAILINSTINHNHITMTWTGADAVGIDIKHSISSLLVVACYNSVQADLSDDGFDSVPLLNWHTFIIVAGNPKIEHNPWNYRELNPYG